MRSSTLLIAFPQTSILSFAEHQQKSQWRWMGDPVRLIFFLTFLTLYAVFGSPASFDHGFIPSLCDLSFWGSQPTRVSVVHEVIFPNVETFNDIEFTYAPGFAPVLLAPQRNHAVQALVVLPIHKWWGVASEIVWILLYLLSEAWLLAGICYDLLWGIAGTASNNPPVSRCGILRVKWTTLFGRIRALLASCT